MYQEQDLAAIAKRENNKKRKYLIVNRLQGKHIPVSPTASLSMFHHLAQMIKENYQKETLLLIGFAETATAIGAELAIELNSYYIQTTREQLPGADYLFFTEDHSHAREQKLVKNDIDRIISLVDRIIFVEDEVTTGNTILNIINIIETYYPKKVAFSVASLLNGMEQEALSLYQKRNIRVHYLLKTYHKGYAELAETYRGDGIFWKDRETSSYFIRHICIFGCQNARRLVQGAEYLSACEHLWKQILKYLPADSGRNLLVLGTEEFMFPALFIGRKLEEAGNTVKCHASTRSPIIASTEPEYPLYSRYELKSMYEKERIVFLYNIARYDQVLIITDAENPTEEGIDSLCHALASCGNENILLFRWWKD